MTASFVCAHEQFEQPPPSCESTECAQSVQMSKLANVYLRLTCGCRHAPAVVGTKSGVKGPFPDFYALKQAPGG
jgi:hypothetical protein